MAEGASKVTVAPPKGARAKLFGFQFFLVFRYVFWHLAHKRRFGSCDGTCIFTHVKDYQIKYTQHLHCAIPTMKRVWICRCWPRRVRLLPSRSGPQTINPPPAKVFAYRRFGPLPAVCSLRYFLHMFIFLLSRPFVRVPSPIHLSTVTKN